MRNAYTNMYIKHFVCRACKSTYANPKKHLCACGESLSIQYDYASLKKAVSWKRLRSRAFGHWRYREFFPVFKDKHIVSLDEGGTSLIPSKKIRKHLCFKFEGMNPTGSFKDRGSTLEISRALELGVKKLVVASTGNMASSVAAYAARAGLDLTVYLAKQAVKEKRCQIQRFGAKVHVVRGDYTIAAKLAIKDSLNKEIYLLGDYAYRGEGEKSVAFEIMDEWKPDYIILPMGNGTLMQGTWKGLREMKRVGLIRVLPKLIGVQASKCNPITNAFKKSSRIYPQIPRTLATAIACGDPSDGIEARDALIESKGQAVTVTDREILRARKKLAILEGIDVEPSSATVVAALEKIKIPASAKVVAILTGSGLKDASNI